MDFLHSRDLDRARIERLLQVALKLKADCKQRRTPQVMTGHSAALVFQKPSLRTRVTFDLGVHQLGGHAIYLSPNEISLGVRESASDVARNLERWVDVIVARVFQQADLTELSAASSKPVINALSDDDHPCQAVADFLTLIEHKKTIRGLKLAWVGDGNNVCSSYAIFGATLGADVRIACPPGYVLSEEILTTIKDRAAESGGKVLVTSDPVEATDGADAIYTDTWSSMHNEDESEERREHFRGFQINAALVQRAKSDVIVMHCLPAHRGEEITDEVMDGPHSVVFDQAENRLHAHKAILVDCLGKTEEVLTAAL